MHPKETDMRLQKTSPKTLAIILAITALPLIGIAHAGKHGMGGSGYSQKGDCNAGGMRNMDGQYSAKRLDDRINSLKAELDIKEDQVDQWQAVEEQMRTGMSEQAGKRTRQGLMQGATAQMSAPERIAAHIDWMESRLEHMKKMQLAVNDLYAVLTPEQKQSADALFPAMGRKGRHMR
jgi:Spy/CpxP family protein refolding chaperone